MTAYENTIIVGGGKGGVGKSTCTHALLYYLAQLGKEAHLIEADTSNPDVAKAHQRKSDETTASLPMSLLDLDVEDGWLELLNVRAEHPQRTLVVNTGARSNLAIDRFGPLLAAGLEELGAPLVTVWMIDSTRDCLELLAQYRKTFPASLTHVMRNAHLSRTFELYDESKLRRELERSGGRSLTLPALTQRVAQVLSANRLSLTDAQHCEALHFGHKVALRRWLVDVSAVLKDLLAAA
jgi:hypothetical protein